MKYLKFNLLAWALLALFITSCDDDDDDPVTPTTPTEQTIAEIASGDARFSTLVDALQRANLVGVLSNPGTYTVFAPTNDAFQDLLDDLQLDDLDALENALGTDGLRQVLLYHVLGAEVAAAQVTTGFTNSLAERIRDNGEFLDIYIDASNGVRLNDAADVTQADINASNGVIHVINAVITPRNVVELAILSPDHTRLVSALTDADNGGNGTTGDLIPVLSDASGLYTVFAPTNEAFQNIESTVNMLSAEQLAEVLKYHVINNSNVTAANVPSGAVPTLEGQDITFDTSNGVVITDASGGMSTVVGTDIQGTNGVIHVVNAVLVPTL